MRAPGSMTVAWQEDAQRVKLNLKFALLRGKPERGISGNAQRRAKCHFLAHAGICVWTTAWVSINCAYMLAGYAARP